MARPCKPDTVFFKRQLTPEQRAVILSAGQGDLSVGFHELLALYASAYAQGYRPGDSVRFVSNENDSHNDLQVGG
jgi:hypothetical protein